MNMDKISNRI